MKTLITLISLIFLFPGPTQKNKQDLANGNTAYVSKTNFTGETIQTEKKDTTVAYKVIRSNPTLRYTVRKIGNGSTVLFSINDGRNSIPNYVEFSNNGGVYYITGNKKGYENVTFPFKCEVSSSVNYMVNQFNNKGALLNDFEIEIYEPGFWEINFKFRI